MFDAASLPDDDAWAAMTKKMKEAQQGKAKAEHDNSYVLILAVLRSRHLRLVLLRRQLKTRIAELELQHEQ